MIMLMSFKVALYVCVLDREDTRFIWHRLSITGISAETIKWAQETEMDGTGLAVAQIGPLTITVVS